MVLSAQIFFKILDGIFGASLLPRGEMHTVLQLLATNKLTFLTVIDLLYSPKNMSLFKIKNILLFLNQGLNEGLKEPHVAHENLIYLCFVCVSPNFNIDQVWNNQGVFY